MNSDTRRFELILREELSGRNTGEGFGTLKEKRMHRVIRRYVLDDPDCWEIPLPTGAVADVLSGGTVYEIQTGSFYPLSGKIARITAETGLNITVVHPVIVKNRIIKIDPDGSVSEPKTSPVRESFFSLLAECVYIAGLFASGRLTVRALYVEAEDYRLRVPGKRRMKKIEVLFIRSRFCRKTAAPSLPLHVGRFFRRNASARQRPLPRTDRPEASRNLRGDGKKRQKKMLHYEGKLKVVIKVGSEQWAVNTEKENCPAVN